MWTVGIEVLCVIVTVAIFLVQPNITTGLCAIFTAIVAIFTVASYFMR